MPSVGVTYRNRIRQEVAQVPDEYLPLLWQIVQTFRRSVRLKSADASFHQGWTEASRGETLPVEDLWTGVDAV